MALRWSSFGPPPGSAAPRAATPDGTVVYAVGDIHGCDSLLRQILGGIRVDARLRPARRRVLVLLGDYVNRGAHSRAVIETLIDPGLPGFEVVALKGNNEDAMLRYLDGDLAVGAHWLDYGGGTTLADYGLAAPAPPTRSPGDLEAMRWKADELDDYGVGIPGLAGQDVPALEALRRDFTAALAGPHDDFLRSLRVSHREGGYHFVHAGIVPGLPLEAQPERDCMWIRKRFLDSPLDHGAVIVHGHSIAPEPEVRANRIGIDTGAYKTGILTCLVLDGEERGFLQACAGRRTPACAAT